MTHDSDLTVKFVFFKNIKLSFSHVLTDCRTLSFVSDEHNAIFYDTHVCLLSVFLHPTIFFFPPQDRRKKDFLNFHFIDFPVRYGTLDSRRITIMEKITSFTINHLLLQPGVYVSRKDPVGGTTVTTFDLRLTSPNEEPVMNTAEVHAIEHLGATFLRNHPVWSSKVLYFGPMGCRTGFYLLLSGDYESKDIVSLMIEMWEFIRDYEGEIPGASPRDCGNYLDMNLPMAKYLAKKYLEEVLYQITEDRLVYPE